MPRTTITVTTITIGADVVTICGVYIEQHQQMFFLPILLFFFLETPEAFDPRISPHEYGKKTVSQSSGSSPIAPKRTGLLVVDHGSRNAASNSRLSEIASSIAYSFPPDKFTVIAHAHMEIAEPSIPTALTQMFESGKVDRVSKKARSDIAFLNKCF